MLCCVQAVTALKLLTQTKTCLGKTLASETIFLFVHFSGPFSCCVVLFLHINSYWYIPVKNFHISSRLYFIIYSLYFYYLQFMFLLLTAIHTRYHCYSIRFIFVGFLICLTINQSETELFWEAGSQWSQVPVAGSLIGWKVSKTFRKMWKINNWISK